jgi:hypothetical protein
VGQHRGERHRLDVLVDDGRLQRRDLMLAQYLPDNIEAARQRRIAEGAAGLVGPGGESGSPQLRDRHHFL